MPLIRQGSNFFLCSTLLLPRWIQWLEIIAGLPSHRRREAIRAVISRREGKQAINNYLTLSGEKHFNKLCHLLYLRAELVFRSTNTYFFGLVESH